MRNSNFFILQFVYLFHLALFLSEKKSKKKKFSLTEHASYRILSELCTDFL